MDEKENKKIEINEIKDNVKKKRKHKDGIWFADTANIENFAVANAEKVQRLVEDIIFYGITVPIQLIQTIGVVVIAVFNDAFPELAFFLIGFFFTRSFLGETFHLHSTVMCTTFTWTSFFIITALVPSIYISVFLCILLGCLMATYMHYIVVKDEEKCQKD